MKRIATLEVVNCFFKVNKSQKRTSGMEKHPKQNNISSDVLLETLE